MTTAQPVNKACHNCRRRRWKCDKSLPFCTKCSTTGQKCEGYQRLLRWETGVASRGKMMGKTFGNAIAIETNAQCFGTAVQLKSAHTYAQDRSYDLSLLLFTSLSDPLVQDLDSVSRMYVSYFSDYVCKDLVVYDVPQHNPMRDLIPWTHHHPILLHAISANAALHMSNACQGTSVLSVTSAGHHKNALIAKQKALCMLRSALQCSRAANAEVILAAVLLFIELELIDSGGSNWRSHIKGAKAIIDKLCESLPQTNTALGPLRLSLISNYLVFDTIGSTFTSSPNRLHGDSLSANNFSLLQDAEGNHCTSFPASLLRLIQAGSLLHSMGASRQDEIFVLLESARTFEPSTWASDLQKRSPASDLQDRTRIACVHRAAVCIYLSRILLSFKTTAHSSVDLEPLVDDAIAHLSLIHYGDPLFTATTWPTFIVGAETNDRKKQDWVVTRFQELWKLEPWGSNREALGVLQRLWAKRRKAALLAGAQGMPLDCMRVEEDWIAELKTGGVDWLVI